MPVVQKQCGGLMEDWDLRKLGLDAFVGIEGMPEVRQRGGWSAPLARQWASWVRTWPEPMARVGTRSESLDVVLRDSNTVWAVEGDEARTQLLQYQVNEQERWEGKTTKWMSKKDEKGKQCPAAA